MGQFSRLAHPRRQQHLLDHGQTWIWEVNVNEVSARPSPASYPAGQVGRWAGSSSSWLLSVELGKHHTDVSSRSFPILASHISLRKEEYYSFGVC
jgi:hypothetical protein